MDADTSDSGPGTGKTFTAERFAGVGVGQGDYRAKLITVWPRLPKSLSIESLAVTLGPSLLMLRKWVFCLSIYVAFVLMCEVPRICTATGQDMELR